MIMEDLEKLDKVMNVLCEQIQEIKKTKPKRERSLAITKIEEAIMWLEKDTRYLNIEP